ncbi:hypothetical protein O181_115598 [Austropuccinia psidii MF-1]|uniref:Uncharacterized protein n=1 Tax=Austropuccinia psidii MF-1 TaxID=1389203 RepID=A0A9Q3PVP6_9BASI|nr:hypothetical protein [Austropuccinia psidii MF-1]
MNPLPDPLDPANQIDMPAIFKGKPELTQQGNSKRELLHLVLQKGRNLENQTNQTAPQLMKLVTRLFNQLDTMNQRQQAMEEAMQKLNKQLDNLENSRRSIPLEVSTPAKNPAPSKIPPHPSFAAIAAKNQIPRPSFLPNELPPALQMSQSQEMQYCHSTTFWVA